MNLKPISLSGLATIAGLVLLPATQASAWWACPSGYEATVQTRNSTSNVRCMKPEDTKAFNECPNATANGVTVGTGHKRNYAGSRDKCVGYIGGAPVIVLDLSCSSGYSQQVLAGDDRCRRAALYAPPTRNVP